MTEKLPPKKLSSQIEGSRNLFQILTSEGQSSNTFNEFVAPLSNMVVGSESRYSFSNHMIAPYDRDHWWIPMDHCYARPWNWRPESTFLRPTKILFMNKPTVNKRKSTNPLTQVQDFDDVIDVVTKDEELAPIYDRSKAKYLMEECERYASLARIEGENEDWEEKISRVNWTSTQNRLFNGMTNILNNDHLARLANADSHNEPIARRVTIDKSVERVRRLLATVSWDPKYTQWLHQLLIDNLSTSYLAAYLDILQTLRSKLPTFVDKMMTGANNTRLSLLGYENLFPLLKKPWDPVALSLMQDKPKKIPGSPVIVVVPSTPISSKRMLKWINLLSNLATVITIPSNYGGLPADKKSMMSCVDQMFIMTRNKIQDIRMDYPGRNIVLAGFGFGATLALQVAQAEQVLCVISIGFSLLTADGKRGEPDDNLLELQCPVLFVIGQCSSTSLQEDMEDLRERMRVETGLIVVGSADDNLRVSKKKKKAEGITQSIVDRCVIDEIGEFISGVILSPFPPQLRQSPTNLTVDGSISKKVKTERKRYNSNTSSLDSEPPSPTPRITRPGQNSSPSLGRPPGSKSKTKLEARWAAQGTPPSPSNSPPHLSTIHTPDTSSNDSSFTDKHPDTPHPVKKIKTLKPTISSDKSSLSTQNQTSPAKAMGLQNRSLPGLLQGDIHTLMQPSLVKSVSSGIKILENVKVGGPSSKVFPNSGKIESPKISIISTKSANGNSLVVLPDGKIKALSPNVKMPGKTTVLNIMDPNLRADLKGNRYITSKRQLLGNKPPKPVKRISFIPQPLQNTNLPPPTNLTTQDIMDLPIIFADDNQILDNSLTPEVKPISQIVTPPTAKLITGNVNKFMVINRPQNFVISQTPKINAIPPNKIQPRYTKIILSSKKTVETSSSAAKPENEEVNPGNETASAENIVKNVGEESAKRTAEDAEIVDADAGPSKVLKLDNDS